MFVMSAAIGLTNSVVSLVYKLVLIFTVSAPIGIRRPSCVSRSRILCRGWIAIMNNKGDSGSPCLRPHLCYIGLPAAPLSRILAVVVRHRSDTRSRQCCPKPNCCMTFNIYSRRYQKLWQYQVLIASLVILIYGSA
jgi:hypothetical protein